MTNGVRMPHYKEDRKRELERAKKCQEIEANQQAPEIEKLREKIAIRLHTLERSVVRITIEISPINCAWEDLDDRFKEYYFIHADAMLRQLAQDKNLGYRVELKLPENPYGNTPFTHHIYCSDGYNRAQKDILKANPNLGGFIPLADKLKEVEDGS